MSDVLQKAVARLHEHAGSMLVAPVLAGDMDALGLLRASIEAQTQATALVSLAAERAREDGFSWQDIGDVLGVTRQAAFQRFGRPTDPRTGEPMNTTPLPEAMNLAGTVIDALSHGRWEDVTARFDATMRDRVSEEALAAAWVQVIATSGAYQSRGPAEATRAADFTVTDTPLAFEAGEFTARISFRDDHTIAGLFILPAHTAA